MRLEVQDVSVSLRRKPIVHHASLAVADGEFVGLLGPNGSGKSTLLRAIYRLNNSYAGSILWNGRDARSIPQREFARHVAVVSQFNDIAFDFTVAEVVLMGRSPHLGMLTRETADDQAIVSEALEMVEMGAFGNRSFASLSGGERQRVILARALAQRPKFLVLDEPTNHLDIKHQLSTLAIVRELGVSCLAALHDLSMASHFVDRAYLMKDGRIVVGGTPEQVMTSEGIRDVYGVESTVEPDPDGGVSISFRYPARRRPSVVVNPPCKR